MTSLKTQLAQEPLGQVDSLHHVIASDRVEGTAVLNRDGVKIGTINRVMIDKVSGQVAYAVMSSGGMFEAGERYQPIPWRVLNFNSEEGAYVLDLERERLEGAPFYSGHERPDWSDREYRATIGTHYGAHDEQTSLKPLIESDRVEGTAVFDVSGKEVGEIKRVLIEKVSGQALYAEMTFGGFLGLGAHHYTIPWDKLTYDTALGGYRTDITEEQVRGAPASSGESRGSQWIDEYWRRMPPQ